MCSDVSFPWAFPNPEGHLVSFARAAFHLSLSAIVNFFLLNLPPSLTTFLAKCSAILTEHRFYVKMIARMRALFEK